MSAFRLLLKLKMKILLVLLFEKKRSARMRTFSILLMLFFLVYASYLFFNGFIFKFVVGLEDIGFLLIERLISTGYLVFFFMLIVSSFVTALAMLFRSDETEYLFSTPTGCRTLFTGKFIDIIVYSSWAILFMGLPILYSYAKVREFGTLKYMLTGILILLPYVLIASSIGVMLAILGMYFSKKLHLRTMVLGSILLFCVLLLMVIKFAKPTELIIPFTEDFRALNLFVNNLRMNSHPLTPNFWLIQGLRALVFDNWIDFWLYSAALLSSALFSCSLLYYLVDRIYFNTWLYSIEQTRKLRTDGSRRPAGIVACEAGETQFRTLLNKDVVMFLRDPAQWSQLFLLLSLLVFYFMSLALIPEEIEIEQWRTIISLMNFGFCGFLMATLSVRFAYPAISLEGTSYWVLESSPLSMKTLFRQKFWTFFTVFTILTEIIALISGIILDLESLYLVITIAGIFLMSAALSSIAVGFGAAWPDFAERNPGRIASSPGGILTVIVSLFYIGAMIALVALPLYRYTTFLIFGGAFPVNAVIISSILALVLNSFAVILPLRYGASKLAVREA